MTKKTQNILLFLLIICLVFAGGVTGFKERMPLSYILDSCVQGDFIYGIDDNEEQVRFFVSDEDGVLHHQISVNREEDGAFYIFDSLSLDEDGKMYVLGVKMDILTNRVLDESVYFCDFEARVLRHYQTLPIVYETGQNNISVKVKHGKITYLTYEFSDELVTTVYQMDENGQISEKHQMYFDPRINIYEYAYSEAWNVVFVTPNNKVYRSLDSGSVQEIYPNDAAIHQLTDFYYDGADLVYVTDVAVGQVVQINLRTGDYTYFYDITEPLGDGEYSYSALEKIRYRDGKFSATVQLSNDISGLGLYQNGDFHVFTEMTLQRDRCVKIFLKVFLLAGGSLLLLFGAVKLFVHLNGRRHPILLKLILALIPIVIASISLIRYHTEQSMTTKLMNAQYQELYQSSQNFLAGVNKSYWTDIDLASVYENPSYFEFQNLFFNRSNSSVKLMGDDDEKSFNIEYFSYIFAYQVRDGRLYSYFCDPQPVNMPVEYKQSEDMSKLFYQCVEKRQPVKAEYRDKFGNWNVVLIPIFDAQKNIVAVLETGMSKVLVDYNIEQEMRQITIVSLLTMFGMLFMISVTLKYYLYPLKRLKKGVEEMGAGNFDVTVPVRGRDEIAEITEVFNQMCFNIKGHIWQIEQFNRASFRFIPFQIFNILKKEGVVDIQKGDNTTQPATALSFHTVTFNTRMRTMTGEEMYRLINQILSLTVPVVLEKQGVISQFKNAGIESFFTGSSESALNCAVSICQQMAPLENQTGFEGIRPAIGLSYGQTKLGIIGTEQRLEAVAISESTNLAQFLQKIAPKYSARILVTGSILEQIPDYAQRYHFRWIGFVYLSATGTLERVYDCYDGDGLWERNLKTETKELFERGVELYCSCAYAEARRMFIEVLKNAYRDDAAKEYLFRCDWQIHHGTEEQSVYLEQY